VLKTPASEIISGANTSSTPPERATRTPTAFPSSTIIESTYRKQKSQMHEYVCYLDNHCHHEGSLQQKKHYNIPKKKRRSR
jgi:hypothetical protein